MSEIKKYYEVDFSYRDNGQIFGSGAHMTEDEKERISVILDRYNEDGAVDSQSVRVPTETELDFDQIVDEIINVLKNEVSDPDEVSKCQGCDRIWPDDIITPIEEVKDLHQRVAKGEPMPAGECPACGALCHSVE